MHSLNSLYTYSPLVHSHQNSSSLWALNSLSILDSAALKAALALNGRKLDILCKSLSQLRVIWRAECNMCKVCYYCTSRVQQLCMLIFSHHLNFFWPQALCACNCSTPLDFSEMLKTEWLSLGRVFPQLWILARE